MITSKIVFNLLSLTSDLTLWESQVSTLFEIYEKHSLSHLLGKAVTESIARLVSTIFRVEKVRAWRDIWQKRASNHPQFQTPLRLLNTAVDYRELGASPFLYLELSPEEEALFKSFLGVEEIPNQLNESQLILDAGNVALTGYKLLGRGVICFFGEKPEYISRKEFIPDELLEVVDRHSLDKEYYELLEAIDGYSPEEEFIVIPSNQRSIKLITFTDIGIDLDKPISDEEYRQELEKVLVKLEQQGLDTETINKLRKETLAFHGQNTSEAFAAYPPEILATLQKCLEEEVTGNLKPFINFCYLFKNL